MRTRPVVGIEPSVSGSGGERLVEMNTRYSDAVYRAGGVPVALAAPLDDGSSLDCGDLLGAIDALLVTGGPDFRTEPLGLGPTHPAARPGLAAKQSFDVELVRIALEADIPVLGICYGMQLLGVVAGARLLQHLPGDRPDARVRHCAAGGPGAGGPDPGGPGTVRHDVTIEPGTLAGLAGIGARRRWPCRGHRIADAPVRCRRPMAPGTGGTRHPPRWPVPVSGRSVHGMIMGTFRDMLAV